MRRVCVMEIPEEVSLKTEHIKRRNMWMQVALWVLTVGLYGIYWWYSTLKEMHESNQNESNPLLWTVLLFVPYINLIADYHYADQYAQFRLGMGKRLWPPYCMR